MHTLIKLPYNYDALEPYIDARTMEIHHSKHHQGYVDKLNIALQNHPEWQQRSIEDLLADLSHVPENIRLAVKNNGGGVINHNFFWEILAKGKELQGEVKQAIESDFGSQAQFIEVFGQVAVAHFGSGWIWLVLVDKKLKIMTTVNQDTLLASGAKPILTLDVWEHAYYLKYQNRRSEYINAFFNVINWDRVNELYKKAARIA